MATKQPVIELNPGVGRIAEFLNAEFFYYPGFIQNPDEIFTWLHQNISWGQGTVTVYGKDYEEPRLTCLFSTQPGKEYSYSGRTTTTIAFPEPLELLRKEVSQVASVDFDTCIANLYRNGSDKIGMHSDGEKNLIPNSPIASISIGAVRHFDVWCKPAAPIQHPRYRIDLANGSLLIMGLNSQKNYVHGVPVQKKIMNPRINLTFRQTKQ